MDFIWSQSLNLHIIPKMLRAFVTYLQHNWPFVPIICVLIQLSHDKCLHSSFGVLCIPNNLDQAIPIHFFIWLGLAVCCAILYQDCVRLQRDQLGGGDGGMSLHSAAASMGSMSRKRQSLIATEKLVENVVYLKFSEKGRTIGGIVWKQEFRLRIQ